MAAIVKDYKKVKSMARPSKSARITGRVRASRVEIAKARSQAKSIMKGLNEAEQIRQGKLTPPTFEEFFGRV